MFRQNNDRASYFDFFQFVRINLNIKLSNWEKDALESHLDPLQVAYIDFNQFNKFSVQNGISWGEYLMENDSENIFKAQLNQSFRDYKLSVEDYFMGCPTMLTSEKAALAKVDLIY